jgi:hypothetical protein
MSITIRGRAAAVLLLLAIAGRCQAQAQFGTPTPTEPTAPATPVSAQLLPPRSCPQEWHIDPIALYASVYPTGHGAGCADGPLPCIPYEDRNGPLLIGDPLLDNGPAIPGWLGALELAVVVPRRQDVISQPVTLTSGATVSVGPPNAPLGPRVMPTVSFGYRWGQATGDMTVSYHFVVADGSEFLAPGASLRSRLDLQVLDIDYGNYEPSLGPQWDMKWRIGVRGVINYSDNQAIGVFGGQQTTNRYWGIGPHAALDLRRWLGDSGLALFGRLDTSLPIGRLAERYIDIAPGAAGETRLFQNNQVLSLSAQAGVAWSPRRCDNFRIAAGYTWEHWWDTGSIINVTPPFPHQQLNIQGGFVRLEWNY